MSLGGLTLSELIGALSHALDITEGQPEGHCVRCCWIGMHVGRAMGLNDEQLWELYYTLLLKDLGCSSNAARICELYLSDDLVFKRDFKSVNGSLPKVLKFVIGHTGLGAGLAERFKALARIIQSGDEIAQELIQTRCTRGADIARQLRFGEGVAMGIHSLDEHWNGGGRPLRLQGEAIPLSSRIALLAQVVDVFNVSDGADAAGWEVEDRSGSWFDPAVVSAFRRCAEDPAFWERLSAPDLDQAVFALEPGRFVVPLDDDYLDEIAAAFGEVIDSKSPYTSGHSARVALYADGIAAELGLEPRRRRWLKRASLLHDMGKLGVSNAILDKPGKLDETEWAAVRQHAVYTENILSRIGAFTEMAIVSGAHHERLDGKGYPRGISGEAISLETRIITTADIFDAITAERPYRGAMPVAKTLEIMGSEVGQAIDLRCFEALQRIVDELGLS
jgi:HD-GYP domain-containing protein (c-di-GMP phosphodiesterase class II)